VDAADPEPLVDAFGRRVGDLRISVTDRCNLRCSYCMPADGLDWLPRTDLLSYEEITRVARVCVERFGFSNIRLTGGEPTMRAHLPRLVSMLTALKPASGADLDLALTTNGTTLPLLAADLHAAGLGRVNISCDSLRRQRLATITRRDALGQVFEGIDAALAAGFSPVKVNCVLERGVNDDEVVDFATFGRHRGVTVRFIEFMPLDADRAWAADRVVPAREVVATIDAVYPLEAVGDGGSQPAERFRYRDGRGEVGVIASVTQSFCSTCDRVRLTADGMFRNCLFAVDETDLRAVMRGGGDDDVADALLVAASTRPLRGFRARLPNLSRWLTLTATRGS